VSSIIPLVNHLLYFLNTLKTKTQIHVKCVLNSNMLIHKNVTLKNFNMTPNMDFEKLTGPFLDKVLKKENNMLFAILMRTTKSKGNPGLDGTEKHL